MKRQKTSKNDAQNEPATAPGPDAAGSGGYIEAGNTSKRTPYGLRRYRLRHRIGRLHRRYPVLKEAPPDLVADLAACEYQADRVFSDLEDADAGTRVRLWGLWTRLTQMATAYRNRLGLALDGEDEEPVDDLEARVEQVDPLFLSHRYGTEWLIRHVRPAERALWVERYRDEKRFKARYGYTQPPTDWPE